MAHQTAPESDDADWTSKLGQPAAKLSDNLGNEATVIKAWQVGRTTKTKAILLRFADVGIFALSAGQAREISAALIEEIGKLPT